MKKAKTSLSAVAVAGALVAAGVAAVPAADAAPQAHRRHIARTAPTWVAKAHSLGSAPATGQSKFKVYLAPKGGTAALNAAVKRVSDPASADYRHFISAAAYHRRYDASSATVRAVSRWLASNGLSVTTVEAHHRYLAVRGTNASVQKAFAVKINRYRHRGHTVQANTTAVSVPTSIASAVSTVTGLDTTPRLVKHAVAPPPAGYRNARPCSAYFGQKLATTLPKFDGVTLPYATCGYVGKQYRSAYLHNSSAKGSGVTVAITDAFASPTIASDARTYARRQGDGAYRHGQLTQNNAAAFTYEDECDASGWYGEETLDVEAVHAMAPAAKIRYYGAASCQDSDLLGSLQRAVDENKASIVSNSWSDVEANETTDSVAAYEQVFTQGALQGISFMFSSGDNGDEEASTGTKQVDYPSSDPYVTSVGGTSDAIGRSGRFLFQTGWGTETYSLSADATAWEPGGYLYGAGGGTSVIFRKPWYQRGVVPARFGNTRAVPDIGLDADPQTGMLIGETQTFPDGVYYDEYRIGGTSLASPLFAGVSAVRQQKAGHRLGWQNPTIYRNARSSAITDIKGEPGVPGVVRVNYVNGVDDSEGVTPIFRTFDQDSSLETTRGWDDVTGVGSPNYRWLNVSN